MGKDIPKVIQSTKLQISHQMKPYSSVKAIWESRYTCFSVFGELGQVGEIGSNYPKSLSEMQRTLSKVLNSTFDISEALLSGKGHLRVELYLF